MRFRKLFEDDYTPTPKEIKRFNDIDDGFGEVVYFEDCIKDLKELNKTIKFPFHNQLNYVLKSSKDMYELKSNIKRFSKDLTDDLRYKIEKIMKKY